MDVKAIVLEVAEEILGLEQEEMLENMDLDLFKEGILDSVGSAAMIAHIEKKIKNKLDTDKLEPEDFTSINTIIKAVEKQC